MAINKNSTVKPFDAYNYGGNNKLATTNTNFLLAIQT